MSLAPFASSLAASLAEANLVPGSAASVIPGDFVPTTRLNVSFAGRRAVQLGDLLRVSEVRLTPAVSFEPEPDTPSTASYLLLLIDPDAPNPDDPKFAFWRHWVVSGLKPLGSSHGDVVARAPPALTEYLGPGPKDDSEPHRYLFLLFREPDGLALGKEHVGGEEFTQRRSFDAAAFIEKHNLRLVSLNWMRGAGDGWEG